MAECALVSHCCTVRILSDGREGVAVTDMTVLLLLLLLLLLPSSNETTVSAVSAVVIDDDFVDGSDLTNSSLRSC